MSQLDEVRERLRRPPSWGPNEQGHYMVDMAVEAYERDLDLLVEAARHREPGYDLIVCSCDGGPYLGARRAGTPCCCERCGFITQDQLDAILAAHV